ncbi:MAG: FadR/GntR family transcriptional regulator [Parvibaculales bacterium]
MITQTSATNITHSIVEKIGIRIVKGDFKVGSQLPSEADMATQHQSSRTSIREAIKMLTAKGLVQSWPKRGTIVLDENNWNLLDPDILNWMLHGQPSAKLLREFYIMRQAIEPMAAGLAAIGGNFEEIEHALLAMRHAEQGIGDSDHVVADIAFHAAIFRASGNRFIVQMIPLVDTALKMTIGITNRIKGVRFADVDEHALILDAIKLGDKELAEKRASDLVEEAIRLLENDLEVFKLINK